MDSLRHPNCRCISPVFYGPKVWDIKPPLGWNWTEDDWRMYNFFRDLDSHGGVLSGGLFEDRWLLFKYDKQHPAKSFVTIEDVSNGVLEHIEKGMAEMFGERS